MSKITLQEAKAIAYQKIGENLNHPNRPVIIDEATLEFEWGFVFYYNGKRYLEEKYMDAAYIGNVPILVDKYDGTADYVGGAAVILDSDLEKYRNRKGYAHSLKFPIGKDISNLPAIERVKTLFRTGEIYQVQQGLELMKQNDLFSVDLLKHIVSNSVFDNWTFEEQIIAAFRGGILALNGENIGNQIPEHLEIFNDITCLNLSNMKLELLNDNILQFEKITKLELHFCDIKDITPNIKKINKLKEIELWDTKLGTSAKSKIDKLDCVVS